MTSTASADLAHATSAIPVANDDPKPLRTILIATDGADDADCAVKLAGAYATRPNASLQAISVCEPLPIVNDGPPFAPLYLPEDIELTQANRTASVKAQILRILGQAAHCPSTIKIGVMGDEVARFGKSIKADLIVTGRGRHGMLDRLLGEEHLVRLLRSAECPVLAAEPTMSAPPSRVVIGVDFSADNLVMAKAAVSLASQDAAVYLVHVKPDPPFGIPHPGQWLTSYDEGVRAGVERLREQLGLSPVRVVEAIVVNGHPGVALVDFARGIKADMIAVGAHGAGFFSRLVIGSVTSYLIRAASCSVLAVPGSRTAAPSRP